MAENLSPSRMIEHEKTEHALFLNVWQAHHMFVNNEAVMKAHQLCFFSAAGHMARISFLDTAGWGQTLSLFHNMLTESFWAWDVSQTRHRTDIRGSWFEGNMWQDAAILYHLFPTVSAAVLLDSVSAPTELTGFECLSVIKFYTFHVSHVIITYFKWIEWIQLWFTNLS